MGVEGDCQMSFRENGCIRYCVEDFSAESLSELIQEREKNKGTATVLSCRGDGIVIVRNWNIFLK